MARCKHVLGVLAFDIKYQMKIERTCSKIVEAGSHKTGIIAFDDFAQNLGDAARQRGRRLLDERQDISNAAVYRQRVVSNFLFEQFAVRNDFLLAGQSAKACAFHPDDFDGRDGVVV